MHLHQAFVGFQLPHPPPRSCDTFVALPPATPGYVVFGKNSDRPTNEVQEVVAFPVATYEAGAIVKCTYISIPQVRHTHAVILSKPSWMWGAEMAANSAGVCIGNEAVWTTEPDDGPPALLGMDLVRLVAERASTAEQAVDIIGDLLETHGQGGSCEFEGEWSYHNSFLVADYKEAWVVETAGKWWVAERVRSGVRNISNCLSIRTLGDKRSPGLEEYLGSRSSTKRSRSKGGDGEGSDFAACVDQGRVPPVGQKSAGREAEGLKLLEEAARGGSLGPKEMMGILRDRDSGICMCDGGGFRSNGSQSELNDSANPIRSHTLLASHSMVSMLFAPETGRSNVHWFTATPDPSRSAFKPYLFPQDVSNEEQVRASESTRSSAVGGGGGKVGNSPHSLWSAAVTKKKVSADLRRALAGLEEEQLELAMSAAGGAGSTSSSATCSICFDSAVQRELQLYQQH